MRKYSNQKCPWNEAARTFSIISWTWSVRLVWFGRLWFVRFVWFVWWSALHTSTAISITTALVTAAVGRTGEHRTPRVTLNKLGQD